MTAAMRHAAEWRKKNQTKRRSKNREYYLFSGYFPVDKHGRYADNDEDVAYYKRLNRDSPRSKYLKHQSNKAVRKYKGDLIRPSDYRKIFEYWWTLH